MTTGSVLSRDFIIDGYGMSISVSHGKVRESQRISFFKPSSMLWFGGGIVFGFSVRV